MNPTRRRCAGTNATGGPCGSPAVGEDGFCPAHRPGGAERMKHLGLKGAIASRQLSGLDPGALPPLDSHENAKIWLETVGRAVAMGRLKDRDGAVVVRAVEAWLKATGEEAVLNRLDDLERKIRTRKVAGG